MNNKLKIIFLGTPEFACPALKTLIQDKRFEVQAVITQEDKKTGRNQELTPPPVKILAEENFLPVFQPEKLSKDKQLIEHLKNLQPDFLVVIAYGQIVSQQVLDIPKIKPINIHGSILPKYRGASPIEQTLLNGDQFAGNSIMQMTLKMDQGPVYQIDQITVQPEDNNITLREKLSRLGAEKLPECLIEIASGNLKAIKQNEDEASYCTKISKEDGSINPNIETAESINNKARAYTPWPGIYLNFKGKILKLHQLKLCTEKSSQPGNFEVKENKLYLHCKDQKLEILEIQMEGKKSMPTNTFLMGNRNLFI